AHSQEKTIHAFHPLASPQPSELTSLHVRKYINKRESPCPECKLPSAVSRTQIQTQMNMIGSAGSHLSSTSSQSPTLASYSISPIIPPCLHVIPLIKPP